MAPRALMYEHKSHPPLPRRHFRRRLVLHFLAASALIVGSLALGMAGYAHFEQLGWLDAFLNSAMLLGGMGPVELPRTDGGKIFAGVYALYAGLVFLVAGAVVVAPILHRLMHKFHWQSDRD